MRILTIHKSKGLEFKVVILPFISWHVDHVPAKQPVIWVKPSSAPFNELGIVPVKYGRDLADTIFADYYKEEKCSVYLDNINLLYVACTRAKDAIYGFSVDNPRSESTVAGILKNAFTQKSVSADSSCISLNDFYNAESRIFEFGVIPDNKCEVSENVSIVSSSYRVSHEMESLKLKLHGENYFSSEMVEIRKKINYGKLMHEVFEGINTQSDISRVIQKLVLEGKLNEEESAEIEKRVITLISTATASDWFKPGNKVMIEAGILLPSGNTRRPDRVILNDGKTTIIDFKFGEENPHYLEQVGQYRNLLLNMGYSDIEAFIWYVDKNIIVSA